MTDLKSMNLDEITAYLTENGFEKFRAKQVLSWLKSGAESFDEMKNLPLKLRDFLKAECVLACAEVERKQVSKIDGTVKYLFRLFDGEHVESVVMHYHHGYSICISTQVGCRMGCTFCATGKSGFARNLAPSEMIAQIESAQQDLKIRISNVVLMGMGEPFDNFESVVRFLRLVTSQDSLCIGARHITVSTCGIVPKIYEFADLKTQVNLSVSLHAPTDEMRSLTMPVNRKYPVAELMDACEYYIQKTNRRVTFEYALIDGVNDSDADALALYALLKGMLCHVNLIPVNSVLGADFSKSTHQRQQSFCELLKRNGVNATVRRTLGSDIDASCGQLKRSFQENS